MAKVLRKITSVNGRLFAVDKESVNGGGSVLAPAGEILFGNAGGDGVTSDSGFTYDDTAKHLFIGGPSLDVYSGDPVDFGKATLALGLTATDTSDPERNLCRANLTVNPAAGGAPSMCTIKADISVPAVNAQNIANVVGITAEAVHNGSGEVTQLYGFSADVENDGLGTVRIGWGFDSGIYGAGFDTAYNYYAHDLGGVATNGYYFWADSRGVFRIKEDATFDAVGQAIPTLYNPQFTKYTPGAVDFERIVLSRWNANVAEIGLEAGGTGALRALRLLGASVAVPLLQPTSNDGAALGTTALQFSDLFLASGAVINFANGNVTLTHSSALLTLAAGLDVIGTFSSTGVLTVRDTTGAAAVTIRPDVASRFNVFIGGSNVGAANTTGNQNTVIGQAAFPVNTTGSVNTVIGRQAMLTNTTGSNNTAIGVETLTHNTTGNNNTAIGYGALANITDGSENTAVGMEALSLGNGAANTAIGWRALKANASGAQNIGIGNEALLVNTTGSNNTAIGYHALYTNITGTTNTAIGSEALLVNTGNGNTAIGNNTLKANTTGRNTAIGAGAMSLNTTGDGNSVIGVGVLQSNTSGDNNTALGQNALNYNTTGSSNVAIGFEAGAFITGGATQNQTSGTSVYVGRATMASASGNANEIVIGYNTTGSGSNSVTLGNTSITKTVLRGAVELTEMTAPSAPATNSVRLYAEDNGGGKTRLMALFPTGSAVQIAIEP